MHSSDVRQAALNLIAQGFNDCEVSRRLGVPRPTVRDSRLPRNGLRPKAMCFRCWQPTSPVLFTPADYAELLGLYLGDGHTTQMARAQRLRPMLDAKYPVVVDEAADLISRIVPWNKIGRQFPHEGRMVTLHAYHRRLDLRARRRHVLRLRETRADLSAGERVAHARARREKALTATRNARLGRSLRLW